MRISWVAGEKPPWRLRFTIIKNISFISSVIYFEAYRNYFNIFTLSKTASLVKMSEARALLKPPKKTSIFVIAVTYLNQLKTICHLEETKKPKTLDCVIDCNNSAQVVTKTKVGQTLLQPSGNLFRLVIDVWRERWAVEIHCFFFGWRSADTRNYESIFTKGSAR